MAAKIGRSARRSLMTFGIMVTGAIALWGCNGGDSSSDDSGPIPLTVPKATCGSGDKPETALQGQVPASLRAAGFQGFSCNLQLLAQVRGEGANWQTTEWREGRGKNKKVCAYHGTAAPTFTGTASLPRINYGVRTID